MKKIYSQPTQEEVRKLFTYDPISGALLRKKNRYKERSRNAFNFHPDKYLSVSIRGQSYPVHRIVWLHQTGRWVERLDHKNRNCSDNRLSNLREATSGQNSRNRTPTRAPFSIPGVWADCSNTKGTRWRARIGRKQKVYILGTFDTFTEAVCHRLAAEQCIDAESYELNSLAYLYVTRFVQHKEPHIAAKKEQLFSTRKDFSPEQIKFLLSDNPKE